MRAAFRVVSVAALAALAFAALLLAGPPAPVAADAAAPFGPQHAVPVCLADARRLGAALKGPGHAEDALHAYRYFYFPSAAKDLADRVAAFQLHVNFLSHYSEPILLEFVHPRVCRLDTDLPGWDRAVLEAAQHTDCFFFKREVLREPARFRFYWPGGADTRDPKRRAFKKGAFEVDYKAGDAVPVAGGWLPAADWLELQGLLHAQVPVLNAEWLLAQSCRQVSLRNKDDEGLGYYDFHRLKDRDDLFKLAAFDKAGADRLGKQVRGAQEFSGVSPTPRQFFRDRAQSGPIWVALDTDDASNGTAISQLKEGTFRHQIEEWYFFLANGLPGTFLSNDKGVRVNNAPADKAGFQDDSPLNEGRDGRIHVHLACLRCHAGQVLKPIDDWVRKTYDGPASLGDPDKREALKLQRQYFSDIGAAVRKDRAEYQDAFRSATRTARYPNGLDAQRACEVYARAFHAYADAEPVTRAVAARELGVTEAHLAAKLRWLKEEVKLLDTRLAPLVDGKAPVSRLTWEGAYELAQEVQLGHVPQLRKVYKK